VVACDVGQGDAICCPTARGRGGGGRRPGARPGRRLPASFAGAGGDRSSSHLHTPTTSAASRVSSMDGGRRCRSSTSRRPVGNFAGSALAQSAGGRATPGWSHRSGQSIRAVSAYVDGHGPIRTATASCSPPACGCRYFFCDAETEGSRRCSRRWARRVARRVLKVAHHGSSYQDSALLDAVRPRVALVSVGAQNPYGHRTVRAGPARHRGGSRVRPAGDIAMPDRPAFSDVGPGSPAAT
jgi:competence protein ComEC